MTFGNQIRKHRTLNRREKTQVCDPEESSGESKRDKSVVKKKE